MIAREMRRVRRVVTGTGRWVRPGRRSVAALAVVAAASVGAAWWTWAWATRSASPARTLALAASVHREPLPLDSALEVTWTWSVGGTARLEERWLGLVAPTLPPGLCMTGTGGASTAADGSGPAGGTRRDALARALGLLDDAVRRGAGRGELERRIGDVRELADVGRATREAFLVRYGLARGHAAAGDWAAAAEVLEPVFDGWLSPDRVPDTRRGHAGALVRSGRVAPELATDAFLGRVLAGTVAYHRGEPGLAVARFRRAINAVYYLLAAGAGGDLSPDGHYQRVPVDPGASACDPGAPSPTSLDAYAGLVASYMADAGFRDPDGLDGELARTRLQIDPGDPVGPILEHARRTGADPGRSPIPENLVWAASNLQRVYHHNRLRPEPRLEVTRAVLLLHLTRDSTWAAALARDAEVCAMLGTLASDLHREGAAGGLGRPSEPGRADSARAAVAVQTFARIDRECPGAEAPEVEAGVRSAWIRQGGGYLTRGLGGLYEGARTELAAALAGGSAPVPVVEERVAPAVERVEAHLRELRRGRLPPELPADLPVDSVRRYAAGWWEAVFVDVAEALAARARAPAPGRGIRAGEVEAYLTALESATAHAGLRPAAVYRAGELEPLAAAAGGRTAAAAWKVRTWVRNHPWLAAAGLAGVVAGVWLMALVVHVSWWRYRLLTDRRFYVEEFGSRERRVAT